MVNQLIPSAGNVDTKATRDVKCRLRRRGFVVCAAVAAAAAVRTDGAPTTNIWNGGAGNWNEAANWSAGVVPNAPDADVFIDGGKDAIASVVTGNGTAMGNLTIDSGDSLSLSAANFYGNINLNGALQVTGGTGKFYNNTTISGMGTVTLATTAQLGATDTASLTLGPGVTLAISERSNNSVGSVISGRIVNQGLITLTAPYFGSSLTITGSFTNSGRMEMGDHGFVMFGSGDVLNSGTMSLKSGFLVLGNAKGTFTNSGSIDLEEGNLSIERSVLLADLGTIHHSATSAGTVDVLNTGVLLNTGKSFVLDSTTPPWIVERNGTLRGGSVSFLPGANFSVIGGVFDDVTLASDWSFASPGELLIRKDFTLANVTLTASSRITFREANLAQAIKGSGEIVLAGAGTTISAGGRPLTIGQGIYVHGNGFLGGNIVNQGTITAEAASLLQILDTPSEFTNRGTINILSGGTLRLRSAALNQDAGSLVVDGLLDSFVNRTVNITGGTLSGNGTMNVSVSLGGSGATVSPGHSIGSLSINGPLSLTGGAHYLAEIAGDNAADMLAVSGNLTIGPGDFLDAINLADAVPGHAYLIATYGGTLSGAFDYVTPGYDVTYAPGQIFVTPTPEPASVMLAIAGAPLLLTRVRRSAWRFGGIAGV